MTKEREALSTVRALKLALEAFGEIEWSNDSQWQSDRAAYAMLAIKEALAQPSVSVEQEPAAWMVYTQDGQSVYVTDNPTDIQKNQRALPMYTTPPQRTWVELTHDMIDEVLLTTNWERSTLIDVIFAIEAKLKEKNTHD